MPDRFAGPARPGRRQVRVARLPVRGSAADWKLEPPEAVAALELAGMPER